MNDRRITNEKGFPHLTHAQMLNLIGLAREELKLLQLDEELLDKFELQMWRKLSNFRS